jgi:hypothetical protein
MQVSLIGFVTVAGMARANDKPSFPESDAEAFEALSALEMQKGRSKASSDIANLDPCYLKFRSDLIREWNKFTDDDVRKMDKSFKDVDYEGFESIIRSRYPQESEAVFKWGRDFIEKCV